ncbi:MAG: radical SAM protein [Nitrospirae bacterium]|nr:radical SAM protein [Nitrospirota bacterium]
MRRPTTEDATAFCLSRYDRRKIFYHPEAVASLVKTGDCWPVSVSTGFTTYCNHSCAWCSSAYTTRKTPSLKAKDELIIQPDVWIRNVKILAAGGTQGLTIAGQGEPLLHPSARTMLDAASDLGLRYMLFTNGEHLTDKFFPSLFAGAVAVRFSVDAASKSLHSRWHAAANSNGRGRADFDRVLRNIRHLVEEKRRRGSLYPHIGCQMICSPLTEEDFEGFAALFGEVGVDYVVFKSLQRNRSNEHITVSSMDLHSTEDAREEQAAAMVSRLLDIQSRYQTERFEVHVKVDQIRRAYVKQFNGAERYDRCRAHPLVPMMEPDGNVYLCIDHGGDPEFVIGNIYEDSMDKIWESKRRQDVARKIDLKRKCPAGCFLDETNVILHQITNPDPNLHHVLI